VGSGVAAAGISVGCGATETIAGSAGVCWSSNGWFNSHSAIAAKAMAPPAQTAMVMNCLRLRLFSISARRVARGDGDLSDMVASVSVENAAAAPAPP
jgi:hypothetical protein